MNLQDFKLSEFKSDTNTVSKIVTVVNIMDSLPNGKDLNTYLDGENNIIIDDDEKSEAITVIKNALVHYIDTDDEILSVIMPEEAIIGRVNNFGIDGIKGKLTFKQYTYKADTERHKKGETVGFASRLVLDSQNSVEAKLKLAAEYGVSVNL